MRIPSRYLFSFTLADFSLFGLTYYLGNVPAYSYFWQAIAFNSASIVSLLGGASEGARNETHNECIDKIRQRNFIAANFLSLGSLILFMTGTFYQKPSDIGTAVQVLSVTCGLFSAICLLVALYDAYKIYSIGDSDDIQYRSQSPAAALVV